MIPKKIRIAILSMYKNPEAPGLNYLQRLLKNENAKRPEVELSFQIFQTRYNNEMPDTRKFEAFISTGGPGSPHDGKGQKWEGEYFHFLDQVYLQDFPDQKKKFHFSICHSFQLLCKHFQIAEVNKRPDSDRYGIFFCKNLASQTDDTLYHLLPSQYLMVENRSWQCVKPVMEKMKSLGIQILSKESEDAEAALLALRISPFWLATQFHPETDPLEMKRTFEGESKKTEVVNKFGAGKWSEIMAMLEKQEPSLNDTYQTLLPGFIQEVILWNYPE
jgi:homoserine O-succinyltransferase